jgi:hypothetical protein
MAEMAGGADSLGSNIGKAIAGMLRSMPPPQPKPVAVAAVDPFANGKEAKKPDPLWEMLILRGSTQEKRSFPLSEVRGDESEISVGNADHVVTPPGVGDPKLVR